MTRPRIAIPIPNSDPEYSNRAWPQYARAVEQAGAEAVAVALDISNREVMSLALTCDAILLPGSPADVDPEKYGAARDPRTAAADPRRDNVDELLLQDAYNMRKPILGVCYGVQSLNVWRTGTLVQHIENHGQGGKVQRAHRLTVETGSQLSGIIGDSFASEGDPSQGWVNSSHHQAIEQPGDGLRITARAEDGTIEAVESTAPDHFVLGLQWHPERTVDQESSSRAIFSAFVDAARGWHEHARREAPDFESVRDEG